MTCDTAFYAIIFLIHAVGTYLKNLEVILMSTSVLTERCFPRVPPAYVFMEKSEKMVSSSREMANISSIHFS